ncbi:MAG: ribonuclease G [Candidatus Methylacidiphilales bacterium]
MILKKIKSWLGIDPENTSKEIVITIEPLEKRVALLENKVLEEFHIERESDRSISGNIYKGRVHNIEPALKALFVDIGLEKNAFLHYWDAMPAALDSGVERIERKGQKSSSKKLTSNDIPKVYPPGSDIIVQVSKGPIGTKGARITTNISLAGRYLVLTPFSDQFGISRKIEDPEERKRLRKILEEIDVPEGMGVIIRTVGEGMRARFFVRDLAMLLEQWAAIERKMKETPPPALLLAEPDLVERTVRDFLTDEIDSITVDCPDTYERIKSLVRGISKRSEKRVHLHRAQTPIFETFGIDRQVDAAFRRMVWLKSGAYLVFDETEALVAIDINTGRNKGGNDQENTLLNTNLEAAAEIARQLRLRNIGGIIIIDFIDMKSRRDQQKVVEFFKECLKRDKAKTHVLPISQLGLVEMTRQRVQESIKRAIYMECPTCKGRGMVKTPETMSVEVQREISRQMAKHPDIHELRVIVHPKVLERLRTEDEELLVNLERRFAGRLAFRSDSALHYEEFKILNASTNEELK